MSKNAEDDSVDSWEALDDDRIAALENGDFDQTLALIERMRPLCDPVRDHNGGGQTLYLEREKKRSQRLRDPLNNDETFRELLGVRFPEDVVAEWNRDCCRHSIDFVEPEVHPIPCDSAIIVEPRARRFVHDKAINEIQLNKLAELWRIQDCLLFRLRVSNNNYQCRDWNRRVAHYCRADALPSILDEGLRLCSLSSANDPTEGQRFADFLQPIINVECVKDRKETMLSLQCSFSRRVNDLNQFRLYGRDFVSGGEGTGLCLELNMGYFDNWGADTVVTAGSVRRHPVDIFPDPDGLRIPLYWVLYYDARDMAFYYTPRQQERPFCINTCEKRKKTGVFIYRDVRRNQQGIHKLLKRIEGAFADLKESNALELGWDLCIYLRHLIKDAAFRDEQEMRVLKLFPIDDASIRALNGTGSLSAAYCPLFERDEHSPLQRIIAGPKVKNIRQLRELVQHKSGSSGILDDIAVIQSDVPLA